MSFATSICGGRRAIGVLLLLSCEEASLLMSCDIRPKEFVKASAYPEDSDEEESTVGKMPPSDSEDE